MSPQSFARRALGAIPLMLSVAANAAPLPAESDASATVAVLESLSVLRKDDLDFGLLVVSGGGTAVVNPVTGAVTTTGGVTPVGSTAQRALFTAPVRETPSC
jgi:hypothetical protein